MKPSIYLRIAAVLTLIHCLAHTVQSLLSGPTHGLNEMLVIQVMQSNAFKFAGVNRSYWDFHKGFAWFLSVQLAVQAAVFWLLASQAKGKSTGLRPILAIFALGFLTMAGVSVRYFTPGPVVVEVLIAMCLIGAVVSASNAATTVADR